METKTATNLPKISVITPSYNQGQYIEDAITSVLNQKYTNFEHIIFDACSTDNTLNILNKYAHLKWISAKDKGQCDALNKGFHKATGDIFVWLNADDYMEPNAFNTFIDYYRKNPNADFYYSDYNFVDRNKQIIKKIRPYKRYSYLLNLLYGCYIPTSGSFIQKSYFKKVGYLNLDFRYKMDTEIFERSKNAIFNKIPKVLSNFRYHGENLSFVDKGKTKGLSKQDMESIYIKDRFFPLLLSKTPEQRSLLYKILWYPTRITYLLLKYSRI